MKRALGAGSGRVPWGGVILSALLSACGGPPEGEPQANVAGAASASRRREQLRPLHSALRGPAVAFGDNVSLVVWADTRPGVVFGARVKPDGTVLDPGGFPLVPTKTPFGPVFPNVAFDGARFVVVWMEPGEGIFGVRVNPDGSVQSPVLRILSGDEINSERPGIACTPSLCWFVFTVQGDDGNGISARRVMADNDTFDGFASLTRTAGPVGQPDMVLRGDRFFAVWTDGRRDEANPDVFGNMLLPDGTVLNGPEGFPISEAPGSQRSASVTWTKRGFLVAWEDNRGGDWDILGARVGLDGEVDDPDGIPISSANGDQRFPAVAHHAARSLVVWDDHRSGKHRVFGARVEDGGDVQDPGGFGISRGDFEEEFLPRVARGNGSFFVTYAGGQTADPLQPHDTLGVRVKPNRRVRDSPALLLTGEP